MTERVLGPSGSRRRHTRLLALTALAASALVVFFVGTSGANVSPSAFEGNDGNLVVNTSGNTDWVNVSGLHTGIDDPSGSTDNSFGQGTKEDDPAVTVVAGSIPPQKSDLTRFYEASELASNNHVFIYLAWERTNNLGSANMDFEINQNATQGFSGSTTGDVILNRTNGDILVTYDFGGSGSPVLGILRWLKAGEKNPYDSTKTNANSDCFSANKLPCWGDQKTLNGSISEGAVNTAGTVQDPLAPDAPRTIVQNGFGEASIDLTAAGVITGSGGSGNACSFGSATTFVKSRSSASFPAEVKDFVAPVSTPIVNNCGAFQINKTSTKGSAALQGATFSVTKDGTAITGSPFATDANGHICISSLQSGDYVVTETGAPTGYKIDDTTSHTVTVAGGDTCTGTSAHTIGFTDTPLSTIEVKFNSLAGSGVTTSQITCKDSSNNNIPAVSENGNADASPPTSTSRDDTDETYGNGATSGVAHTTLVPGVYTCTVDIDP